MKKIILIKNNRIITKNAELADSFFSRFRGLMFRKEIDDDYALWITPCNQIHMLNMRFAIDAVYLTESGEVIRTDINVQPGRICKTVRNAESVIEMKSFASQKLGIKVGDTVKLTSQ